MSNTSSFETEIRAAASANPGCFRIGLYMSDRRIPRTTIMGLQREATFELTGSVGSDNRYRCESRDGQQIVEWTRHSYLVHRTGVDQSDRLLIEAPSEVFEAEGIKGQAGDQIRAELLQDAFSHANTALALPRAHRVAGLTNERQQITDFLAHSTETWGLRQETGILLEGPPGTGKTELVKGVCEQLYGDIPTIISGPEVLSKWLGESEAALRNQFTEAKQSKTPVIYIDEIDALGRSRRDAQEAHTAQIVSQLLVLLDGVGAKESSVDLPSMPDQAKNGNDEQSQRLRVIASTNRPDQLDDALLRPGRLGDRRMNFSLPNKVARRTIFHQYLAQWRASGASLVEPLDEFVTSDLDSFPNELVTATDGYTGADIEQAVMIAAREASSSVASEQTPPTLTVADLDVGVEATKATENDTTSFNPSP